MYQERLEKLQQDAIDLGINLDYEPQVNVPDIEAITHDEWLESRKSGIGGSDAGAIMGVNHYSSPTEIAEQKLSIKPQPERDAESQYTLDFGHALEAPILKLYAAKTGNKVWTDRAQYRHPLYPFMLGDCDGMAETPEGEQIGLEIKTYNYDMKNLWESGVYGQGGVVKNPEYAIQVAHYMAVLNLTRFDLIAMCGNRADDMKVITFYRDLNLEKNLYEVEGKFWEQVDMGIIPEATSLPKTSFDRIVQIVREDEPEEEKITFTNDLLETFNELEELKNKKAELKESIKKLEERENALKVPVIEQLANAEGGVLTVDGVEYTVTFKPNKPREEVDKDKLKLNYPEVYETVIEEKTSSPIFRLKRKVVKK